MMPYDAENQFAKQIEHLMTTVVTCRSVVKYNLPLNDEQKHDLQGDIDASLDILRSFLAAAPAPTSASVSGILPSPPPPSPCPSYQSTCMPAIPLKEDSSSYENVVPRDDHEQHVLSALYRMYHSFLSMKQPVNLNTFITRFNEAMSMLHDLQRHFDSRSGNYLSCDEETIGELLQRLRVFIADLYSIFMEFVRALSETLQNNNVQLDTEKLTSLSSECGGEPQTLPAPLPDLAPLFGVYEAHQRLNKKRGLLASRIGEATAFLEFLKEVQHPQRASKQEDSFMSFPSTTQTQIVYPGSRNASIDFASADEPNTGKYREVLAQLNNVTRLLHELSRLLADYEQATATLFVR